MMEFEKSHEHSRKRLRPLLERLLNDKVFPGLVWCDEAKTRWRLPWRHHKKTVPGSEDADIINHIGKCMWPTKNLKECKELLRNALNSLNDVEELVDERKTDIPNSYKVYRFVNGKKHKGYAKENRIPEYGQAVMCSRGTQEQHIQIPISLQSPFGIGIPDFNLKAYSPIPSVSLGVDMGQQAKTAVQPSAFSNASAKLALQDTIPKNLEYSYDSLANSPSDGTNNYRSRSPIISESWDIFWKDVNDNNNIEIQNECLHNESSITPPARSCPAVFNDQDVDSPLLDTTSNEIAMVNTSAVDIPSGSNRKSNPECNIPNNLTLLPNFHILGISDEEKKTLAPVSSCGALFSAPVVSDSSMHILSDTENNHAVPWKEPCISGNVNDSELSCIEMDAHLPKANSCVGNETWCSKDAVSAQNDQPSLGCRSTVDPHMAAFMNTYSESHHTFLSNGSVTPLASVQMPSNVQLHCKKMSIQVRYKNYLVVDTPIYHDVFTVFSGPHKLAFKLPGQLVSLPDPNNCDNLTITEKNIIHNLWTYIGRGINVFMKDNGDIYANRLCKARILCRPPSEVVGKRLEVGKDMKIFDFSSKYPQCCDISNKARPQPYTELWFGKGDKENDSYKPGAITISIIHEEAKKINTYYEDVAFMSFVPEKSISGEYEKAIRCFERASIT